MRASNFETRVSPGFFRQIAASRWAKPLVRMLSIALALVVLAAIGSSARAIPQTVAPVVITSAEAASPIASASTPAATAAGAPTTTSSAPATSAPPPTDHTKRATVDDPVTLNTATLDDLERLPGIGPKRAAAILELRQKLGRFRQLEDLMRVKGVGRATLKKLRPIVKLD